MGTQQPASSRQAYWTLALLTLVYLVHSIDRQVISVVLEPIRHEFHASDKMLGLIALAYSVLFALACLPAGWLIDRTNRVRLLSGLLAGWSGLTALCGFTASFAMLLLARAGVGAAEAGASPTIMSLISDYFEPRRRALAIGICYTSTAFGVSASFLIGSIVAAAHGWRAAFWVAGAPGLILAASILATLREPTRGAMDRETTATVADARVAGIPASGTIELAARVESGREYLDGLPHALVPDGVQSISSQSLTARISNSPRPRAPGSAGADFHDPLSMTLRCTRAPSFSPSTRTLPGLRPR